MVETGAQKRKAEDETAALANDTLGQHDQPASKKIKSEDDETNTAAQTRHKLKQMQTLRKLWATRVSTAAMKHSCIFTH